MRVQSSEFRGDQRLGTILNAEHSNCLKSRYNNQCKFKVEANFIYIWLYLGCRVFGVQRHFKLILLYVSIIRRSAVFPGI